MATHILEVGKTLLDMFDYMSETCEEHVHTFLFIKSLLSFNTHPILFYFLCLPVKKKKYIYALYNDMFSFPGVPELQCKKLHSAAFSWLWRGHNEQK